MVLGFALLSLTLATASAQQQDPDKEKSAAPQQSNQIYDEPQMPLQTQYPLSMQVQSTSSGEGCGFTFTFKPQQKTLDQARVHIFLPRGVATAAAHELFVTGPCGLLKNNGWKKATVVQDNQKFHYGWVKKVISFADPGNKKMRGKILLGEAAGQAVQVTLYYPGDLSQEFFSNAKVILSNLSFRLEELPPTKRN
jgi:hypothetical protein